MADHKFLGQTQSKNINHGGQSTTKGRGYKPMWDFMDKAEGRKDSSWENKEREAKNQGYK